MWAYTSSAGTESGLVEGVCVLHIEIDGYGVVVAVKVSWDGGEGQGGIDTNLTVTVRFEAKKDLTTGFPDIENGGGEVWVVVVRL